MSHISKEINTRSLDTVLEKFCEIESDFNNPEQKTIFYCVNFVQSSFITCSNRLLMIEHFDDTKMSETLNKELPVVNVVKKNWVNFGDRRVGEQQVGNLEKDDKQDESSNIQLPKPPRKHRKSDSDRHDRSTPYLLNSSSSSSKNHLDNSTNETRSTDRSTPSANYATDRSNEKSTRLSNDCTLNIPETLIKSNSVKLQNVPLKDIEPASDKSLNSQSTSQSNSRFKNGDIIVSLLPLNTHCAWITPALFKPELVPEELMSPVFRLTVEDYVQAMSTLVNDYRFNLYIVFYKKVTLIWLTLGFCILFSLLFSNAEGMIIFFGLLTWLLINAFGFLLTFWMKVLMLRNLERCLARVNEQLYKNNIILAVDDKGKLSCHKITLVFMYFDATECIKHLNDRLNREGEVDSINNTINNLNQLNNNNSDVINLNKYPTAAQQSINMSHQDVEIDDIIITGPTPTRLTQKERYGEKLFLRYSQRWAKDFTRQRIGFSTPLHYDSSVTPATNIQPRHCEKARCACQYIEEHLSFKPYHRCSLKDLIG